MTRKVPRLGLPETLRFLLDPQGRAPLLHRRHGGMIRLADAVGGMTLLFEPEDARAALAQPDAFAHLDRDTVPIKLPPESASYRLTSGLLAFQNGDKHRALRRELMPAFDARHLQDYFELSRVSVREFLGGLGPGRLDLNRVCHELAMNTALLTLFGMRMTPETRELAASIKEWMQAGFSPWTLVFPFDLPGSTFRRFLRSGEVLEQRMIRLFRQGPGPEEPLVKVVFGDAWKGGELPPELVSRASGYMQASYETTANTLLWTLVVLNLFPATAARVREELEATIGDREIGYADLAGLGYLRSVILETIRLLPPLSLFPRLVTRPVTLGGVAFRPGDRVAYGPILTHRLPHVFPDPDAFDPFRFRKPGNRHEGYFGFGGGPRRCPGEQFGLSEAMLILATWVRKAFPRIEDGTAINARGLVVFTPSGPVPFRNVPATGALPAARIKGTAVRGLKAAA